MESNSSGKLEGVIQGNSELRKHDSSGSGSGSDRQAASSRGYIAEGRKEAAARPCAVIGPESVGHPYTRKEDLGRSWNSGTASSYYQYPYYPTRDISPRQSFQENMSHAAIVPSSSEMKNYQEANDASKPSAGASSKYCEPPILVRPSHVEVLRPSYYPPPPPTPVDYQRYPEYTTPRIQVIKGAQMFSKVTEQTPHILPPTPNYPSKGYSRASSLRYEPYQIKDKYTQSTRYIPGSSHGHAHAHPHEYSYQYPSHVSPLATIEKFNEVKKCLAQSSEYPLRYLPLPTSHNTEYQSKVPVPMPVRRGQHSTTSQYPESSSVSHVDPYAGSQPKLYGYNIPEKSSQYNHYPRAAQDARSKQTYYPQYSGIPYQEPRLNDTVHNPSYAKPHTSGHISYAPVNTHYAAPPYQKPIEVPFHERTVDYDPAYYRYYQKHAQQPVIPYNPLDHVPTQFSPNIISPAESTASCNSVTTLPPQSLEDGGYVSQCSTSSGRSSDPNATATVKENFLEPGPKNKLEQNTNTSSKTSNTKSDKQEKDKKKSLDLRQYYSTWQEELEETPRSQETPNSLESVPVSETSNAVDANVTSVPPQNTNIYSTDKVSVSEISHTVYPTDKLKVPSSQHNVYAAKTSLPVTMPNVPVPPYSAYPIGKTNVSVSSSRATYSAERASVPVPPYGMYASNKSLLPPHAYSGYPMEGSNIFFPQRIMYSADRMQVPVSLHGTYSTAKSNTTLPSYPIYSAVKPSPVPTTHSSYTQDTVSSSPHRGYSVEKSNIPVSSQRMYLTEKTNVPMTPQRVSSTDKINMPDPSYNVYSKEKLNTIVPPHGSYSTEKANVPVPQHGVYSGDKANVPVPSYNAYSREKAIVPPIVNHPTYPNDKGNTYAEGYYRYNNASCKVANFNPVQDYNIMNSKSNKSSAITYTNKSLAISNKTVAVNAVTQKPNDSSDTSSLNEMIDVEAKISQSIIHKDVVFNYDIKPIEIPQTYNSSCSESSTAVKPNIENESIPPHLAKSNTHEVNENNNLIPLKSADIKTYNNNNNNMLKVDDNKVETMIVNNITTQHSNQQNKMEQMSSYIAQGNRNTPVGNDVPIDKSEINQKISNNKNNKETKDAVSDKPNQYVRTVFSENHDSQFNHPGTLYPNCLYSQPVVSAPLVNGNAYSTSVNFRHADNFIDLPDISKPSRGKSALGKEILKKHQYENPTEEKNYSTNNSQDKITKNELNAQPVHESVLKYVSADNVQHTLVDLSNTKVKEYPKPPNVGIETENIYSDGKYSSQYENNCSNNSYNSTNYNIGDLLKSKSSNLSASIIDNQSSKQMVNEVNQASPTNESIEISYQVCEERLSANYLERNNPSVGPKGDKKHDFSMRHCNNIIKHNIDNIILTNADVANSDYKYDIPCKYTVGFDSQIVATDLSMVKNYENYDYVSKINKPNSEVPTVDTPLRTPEIAGDRLEEMGLSSLMIKTDVQKHSHESIFEPVTDHQELENVFDPLQKTSESKLDTSTPSESFERPLQNHEDITDNESTKKSTNDECVTNNFASIFEEPKIEEENHSGKVSTEKVDESQSVTKAVDLSDLSFEFIPEKAENINKHVESPSKCNTDVEEMDLEHENCATKQYDDELATSVGTECSPATVECQQSNQVSVKSDTYNNDIVDKLEITPDDKYLNKRDMDTFDNCDFKTNKENADDIANGDSSDDTNVKLEVNHIEISETVCDLVSTNSVTENNDLDLPGKEVADLNNEELSANKLSTEDRCVSDVNEENKISDGDDLPQQEEGEISPQTQSNQDEKEVCKIPDQMQEENLEILNVENDNKIQDFDGSDIQNDSIADKYCCEDEQRNEDYIDKVQEFATTIEQSHPNVESLAYEDHVTEEKKLDVLDEPSVASNNNQNSQTYKGDITEEQNCDSVVSIDNPDQDHEIENLNLEDNIKEPRENNSVQSDAFIDDVQNDEDSLDHGKEEEMLCDSIESSLTDDSIHIDHSLSCEDHAEKHNNVELTSNNNEVQDNENQNHESETSGKQELDCMESATEINGSEVVENQVQEYQSINAQNCDSVESTSADDTENQKLDDESLEEHKHCDSVKSNVSNDVEVSWDVVNEVMDTTVEYDNAKNAIVANDDGMAIKEDKGADIDSSDLIESVKEDDKYIESGDVCQVLDDDASASPDEGFEKDTSAEHEQGDIPEDETHHVTSSTEIVEQINDETEKQNFFEDHGDKSDDGHQVLEISLNENDQSISFDVDHEVIRHHIESQYHSFQLAIDSDLISADGNILYCQIESPNSMKCDRGDEEKYYIQVDSLTAVTEGEGVSMVSCDAQEVQYRNSSEDVVGYSQEDTCVPWIEDVACVETVVSEEIVCDEGEESQEAYSPEPLWGPNSSSPDESIVDDLPLTPQSTTESIINENSKEPDYITLINNDPILEESQNNLSENEFENLSLAMSNEDHSSSNFSEVFLKTSANIEPPKCQYDQELINVLTGKADCDKKKEDLIKVLLGKNDSDSESDVTVPETVIVVDQKDKDKSCDFNTYQASTPVQYVPNKTISSRCSDGEDTDDSVSSKDSENISSDTYYKNDSFPQGRLITKGAQKYIPPVDVSYQAFKCQLPLPEEKLLLLTKKLNEMKGDKTEEVDLENKVNKIVIPKRTSNCKDVVMKKVKPKFDDVLKDIDESNMTWCKMKLRKFNKNKPSTSIPKVVIKKSDQGSLYTTKVDESESSVEGKSVGQPEESVVDIRNEDNVDRLSNMSAKKRVSHVKSPCAGSKSMLENDDNKKSAFDESMSTGTLKNMEKYLTGVKSANNRRKSVCYETYLGAKKNTASKQDDFTFNKPGKKVSKRRRFANVDSDGCNTESDASDHGDSISAKALNDEPIVKPAKKISGRRKTLCSDTDINLFVPDKNIVTESINCKRIGKRRQTVSYDTNINSLIADASDPVTEKPKKISQRRKTMTCDYPEESSFSKPQKNIVNKPVRGNTLSYHSSPRSSDDNTSTLSDFIKPINKISRRRMTVSCDTVEYKKTLLNENMSSDNKSKKKKSMSDEKYIRNSSSDRDDDSGFTKPKISKINQRRKTICDNVTEECNRSKSTIENERKSRKSVDYYRRKSVSSERKDSKLEKIREYDDSAKLNKKTVQRKLSICYDPESSKSENEKNETDKPVVKKISHRRMTISYASPCKLDKDITSSEDSQKTEKKVIQRRMTVCYDLETPSVEDNERDWNDNSHLNKPAKKIPSRRRTICEDREHEKLKSIPTKGDNVKEKAVPISDRKKSVLCDVDNNGLRRIQEFSNPSARKISRRRMTVANDSVYGNFDMQDFNQNITSYETPFNRSQSNRIGESRSSDGENIISSKKSHSPTYRSRKRSKDESDKRLIYKRSSISSESQPRGSRNNSNERNESNKSAKKINHRRQTISLDTNTTKTDCDKKKKEFDSSENVNHKRLILSCDPEPYIPQRVVKRSGCEPEKINHRRLTVSGDNSRYQLTDSSSDDDEMSYKPEKKRKTISYIPSRFINLLESDEPDTKIKHRRLTLSYDSQPYIPTSMKSKRTDLTQKKIPHRRLTISYDERTDSNDSADEKEVSHKRMTVCYDNYFNKTDNINKKRKSIMYEYHHKESRSPDLSGKNWQPFVSLRKNIILEEMIKHNKCGVSFFGGTPQKASNLLQDNSTSEDEENADKLTSSHRDDCDSNRLIKNPINSASQKTEHYSL